MNTAKTTELKAIAKKFTKQFAILIQCQTQRLLKLKMKFKITLLILKNAVKNENYELASSAADALLSLIDIRNKKCSQAC